MRTIPTMQSRHNKTFFERSTAFLNAAFWCMNPKHDKNIVALKIWGGGWGVSSKPIPTEKFKHGDFPNVLIIKGLNQ
uniref:Uncharacterized protein n=1 Tax=Romanomermis culicivorax TaxID=13658 RepID=A0A915HS01_ROMCU